MAQRLTFTLAGRDELSRVLNNTADASDRLRLRMAGITADADGQLRDLRGRFLSTVDAEQRLGDRTHATRDAFHNLSDSAGKLGEALKANLISLAPAAIPATAALAGAAVTLGEQLGAVALSAAAYGLALAGQITPITDALDAQKKYADAVTASGAHSEEAAKAQLAYQQQLAKMPPETQKAAVAVGLLRDNFQSWSDSLAGDVMGPFNKGVAVANALLPKTTGLVKGASGQFDRLITMLGGAIATPGFDALNTKVTNFANRTLDHAVDELTIFLAKLDTGQIGGSFEKFLDYARQNGPAVWSTLRNVGDALLNILQAGSDVGVGMLDVINALSGIVSAVPPQAIATMLQLAIAIKAVRLAAAGADAARAALLALGVQIGAMRTAAAAAPGPLAATTAAIGALSRTAKLAVAGTAIGLLVLAVTELSQVGKPAALDVDKLTTSLGELGRTGKATGYVASEFGKDFGKLRDEIQKVIDPSVAESINNWGADITNGLLDAGDATEKFTKHVDAIDKGLASLVSGGKADQARLALEAMLKGMSPEQLKKFTGELDNYKDALAGQALEQDLAAQSMGLFGKQAQDVQAKLQAQKLSADGLRESIVALNEVNRQGLDAQAAFEEAIDNATSAATKYGNVWAANGGKLDLTTEKGRGAYRALSDLAAKTNEATTAGVEAGDSWDEVNGVFEKGRKQLIKNARQMGLNREAAEALADQILQTPDKTAHLRGDLEDLKKKLADAKKRLKSVPDSRKAKVRADIAQLKSQISYAERQLAILDGKTVTVYINGKATGVNAAQYYSQGPHKAGGGLIHRSAGGSIPGFPGGGPVVGPGTSMSDSILMWGSRGEYMVNTAAVDKVGLRFMDALNAGVLPVGKAAPKAGLPAAAPAATVAAGADRPAVTYNVYPRASVISAEDLRLLQRQEEARQRVGRPR